MLLFLLECLSLSLIMYFVNLCISAPSNLKNLISKRMKSALLGAVVSLLAVGANADIYMHNLAGSNDRNRERNENR